jgi:hypothetical protein
VVVRTLEEVPERATHWSKRELAKRVGISPTSVLRMWRAFGLQPWRSPDRPTRLPRRCAAYPVRPHGEGDQVAAEQQL